MAKQRGAVPRGGLQLDEVLAALALVGGPATLDQVRGKVGGSAPQVRSALQKLAESGKLNITGERRGPRYVALVAMRPLWRGWTRGTVDP